MEDKSAEVKNNYNFKSPLISDLFLSRLSIALTHKMSTMSKRLSDTSKSPAVNIHRQKIPNISLKSISPKPTTSQSLSVQVSPKFAVQKKAMLSKNTTETMIISPLAMAKIVAKTTPKCKRLIFSQNHVQ